MRFFFSLRSACYLLPVLLVTSFAVSCKTEKRENRILVFSKTAGFRHIDAIEAGIPAIIELGAKNGFGVDTTEDAGKFTEENLRKYRAVIFLNVSGEVFTMAERTAFQRYIQSGGGFVGIHAPVDAERTWPWYGQMIGAYFRSHPANPNIQTGVYHLTGSSNTILDSIPKSFQRTDEFYDFDIMNKHINVLVTIDEKTYQGGKTGDNHPAVWFHEFEGGRSFYTAMGHTADSYTEPLFLKILLQGIHYAMGDGTAPNYANAVPEENRFTKKILMEKLDEPMHLAIDDNGTIYFVQRRGAIIGFDTQKDSSWIVGNVSVNQKYEDGLLGLTLDPDFSKNRQLFVYYTAINGLAFHVARFTLDANGKLDLGSEKILLKIPKDILDGSHTGGALLFDPAGTGNLFITVGDNSSPRAWNYAPIDQRKGKEHWDAQRTSANTNDLRGKILRIHPEPDGTYTIPEGNLFAKDLVNTKPEIYTMGHRQPWRMSIDTKTGWLYVGEVGPDANDDSTGLGPRGYDEFNQIRKPGNFGWPQFIADNKPYWNYDFTTGKSGEQFNPAAPTNMSVNNTGLKDLPPAQKALMWYPYGSSAEFPLMESGARSATGGPIFRKADFKNASHLFPDYFEGKWFIAEWMRGWINVVSLDSSGNYVSMERFMPSHTFSNPIDLKFGPDGSLYMLEYGKGWFRANDDARLVKIEYNKGNRAPVAVAHADRKTGNVPFSIQLSAVGSQDPDQDKLEYSWQISQDGKQVQSLTGITPKLTLDKAGVYTATLTVSDPEKLQGNASIRLSVGVALPGVKMEILHGNKTFFFSGSTIQYHVTLDGKPALSSPKAAGTRVNIQYVGAGFTPLLGDPDPTKPVVSEDAISLYGGMVLNSGDCYSCHAIKTKSAGPSFTEIAERYNNDPLISNTLVKRIIGGTSGQWGTAAMSAHPNLDPSKAKEMVTFILSLSKPVPPGEPLAGKYKITVPPRAPGEAATNEDVFLLEAIYTDSSNKKAPIVVNDQLILRNPEISPGSADLKRDIMNVRVPGVKPELTVFSGKQPYIAFRKIDLSLVRSIGVDVSPASGGLLEIRLGSPQGKVIGSLEIAPGKGSFSAGMPFIVPIEATTGFQDIYIVGVNDKARRSDIMYILTGLRVLL